MAEELKPFKREDRYIVIKRKDLAALADKGELRPASLDGLMDLCADLPAREYVVIESDWPEYPIVWQMIKARMNGSAQLPSQGGDAVEVVAYRYTSGQRLGGKWHYQESFPKWDDRKVSEIGQMDELMTVAQHQRILAAAYQPSSVVPVRVTGSLDEIDAQTWPFINEEARKVGAEKGSIEVYQYERANGGVVVLWDGPRVHAMAVTIRDDLNRTRCIRMLADTHPADQVAELKTILTELDGALEDLELHGRHSDQGYRKLKDWYRKVALITDRIDAKLASLSTKNEGVKA